MEPLRKLRPSDRSGHEPGDEPTLGRWADDMEDLVVVDELAAVEETAEPISELFLADALLEEYEFGGSCEVPHAAMQLETSPPLQGLVPVELNHLAACLTRARSHQDAKDRAANAARFAAAEEKLLAEIPSLATLAESGLEMASDEKIGKLIELYNITPQTWNEVASALAIPETLRSAQENLARSLGLDATASLDEINFAKDIRVQFSIDAIVSEVKRELAAIAENPEKHLARRCPDGSVTVLRRKLVLAPQVQDPGYSVPTSTAGGVLACGATAIAVSSLSIALAVVTGAAGLAAGALGARAAYNVMLLRPSRRCLTQAISTPHVRALQKSLEELGVRCEIVRNDGWNGKRYERPYLSLLVTVLAPEQPRF